MNSRVFSASGATTRQQLKIKEKKVKHNKRTRPISASRVEATNPNAAEAFAPPPRSSRVSGATPAPPKAVYDKSPRNNHPRSPGIYCTRLSGFNCTKFFIFLLCREGEGALGSKEQDVKGILTRAKISFLVSGSSALMAQTGRRRGARLKPRFVLAGRNMHIFFFSTGCHCWLIISLARRKKYSASCTR